jgi:hypothetical protein
LNTQEVSAPLLLANWRTPLLLANWRLQRANLEQEIAFVEGNPHGPDTRVLKELRTLAAELDRLIDGCLVGKVAALDGSSITH